MSRASAAERGYGSRWQQARKAFLTLRPWCVMCANAGRQTRATVVDHIEPHRGDRSKFWNRRNWQPLCKACHDGPKQSQERTGIARGCDENGIPLDGGHHWR